MLPVTRFLKAANVRLELIGGRLDAIDPEKDRAAELRRLKGEVVEELIDLFASVDNSTDPSITDPHVSNRAQYANDFRNRSKQPGTAWENGLAIPHVRTQQARYLALVFARSRAGVWYDAPDGKPSHLFFGISAPSWDKEWFQPFYSWIGRLFTRYAEWLPESLLAAETADDIVKLLATLD